jgi:hypothetical protein
MNRLTIEYCVCVDGDPGHRFAGVAAALALARTMAAQDDGQTITVERHQVNTVWTSADASDGEAA